MTEEPPRSATPDDIEAALNDLRAGLGVPPPDESEPPPVVERPRGSRTGAGLMLLVAALLGGGVAAVAPGVLGLSAPVDAGDSGRIAALETRLAQLAANDGAKAYRDLASKVQAVETRLRALETAAAVPAPPSPDRTDAPVAGGALADRVGGLESGLADLRTRLAAVDERLGALAAAPAGPASPSPDQGAREAELAQIGESLAALDQRLKTVETSVPVPQLIAALDRRISELEEADPGRAAHNAALALVVSRLAEATDSGRPFVTELTALKHVAPTVADLTAFEPYAATGLPTIADLARQLADLDSAVRAAADADRGGDWLARFLRTLGRLVVITTADDPQGSEPEDRLVRAQRRAAGGDLDQAAAELSALSGSARQTVEPWLAAARARLALDAAIAKITAAILQDLTRAVP